MKNQQPTSAPYTSDLVKPYDDNLLLLKEFGTNVTANVGDPFIGDALQPVATSVNARMGMLQVEQTTGPTEDNGVQGSTFLLPPWSSYPTSPLLGPDQDGPKAIVVYAHILKREDNTTDPDSLSVGLVLGSENFVGDVSTQQATLIGCGGETPMGDGGPSAATLASFGDGAGTIASDVNFFNYWGSNLYIRMMLIGDDTKEAESFIYLSHDGLSWKTVFEGQLISDGLALRRLGLGVYGGDGVAWLDWFRVYSYPVASQSSGGLLLPLMPLTGDRLF